MRSLQRSTSVRPTCVPAAATNVSCATSASATACRSSPISRVVLSRRALSRIAPPSRRARQPPDGTRRRAACGRRGRAGSTPSGRPPLRPASRAARRRERGRSPCGSLGEKWPSASYEDLGEPGLHPGRCIVRVGDDQAAGAGGVHEREARQPAGQLGCVAGEQWSLEAARVGHARRRNEHGELEPVSPEALGRAPELFRTGGAHQSATAPSACQNAGRSTGR